MKKFFAITLIAVITSAFAMAQKFAYVDSEYILNNVPAYKSAQDQLDKFSNDWQKEFAAWVGQPCQFPQT